MNFHKIKSIKRYDECLNVIFKKSRNIKDYIKKINNVNKNINDEVQGILDNFPNVNNLNGFYRELIKIDVNWEDVKKSFSKLIFIKRKGFLLSEEYKSRIKNGKNKNKILKGYYGRISSLFKKYKKNFEFLEETRKKFKRLPVIKKKESIGIVGYPNVGKSTLLRRLTGANPRIGDYAFTTQKINLGYLGKLQIIDLPGSLDRDFDKMNKMEKYSYLAIKYLCKKVVFIFDLSESSDSITKQEGLFERNLKEFRDKEFLIFFSKVDLVDKELVNRYIKKYDKFRTFDSYGNLKKFLVK